MGLCGSDQDKERLVKRLHRIEGQVRGLCGMVEKDSDCMDVLRQIASLSGALRGVWTQVVGDHIRAKENLLKSIRTLFIDIVGNKIETRHKKYRSNQETL